MQQNQNGTNVTVDLAENTTEAKSAYKQSRKDKKTNRKIETNLKEASATNDHRVIKQVTQHTETITGCVVADVRTTSDQRTKQQMERENTSYETGEINIAEADQESQTPTTNQGQQEEETAGQVTCECRDCNNGIETDRAVKNRSIETIKELLESCSEWPSIVGKTQLVFGQGKTHTNNTKGHLAQVQLCKCKIKLAQDTQGDNEVTVLNDANSFMYGIPTAGDCKFKTEIRIKLTCDRNDIMKVQRKQDKHTKILNCTNPNTTPWVMQDTEWVHYRVDTWLDKMTQLTEQVENLYGVHLTWQRNAEKHTTIDELLCPVVNTITPNVRESVKQLYTTEDDNDYDKEEIQCCQVEGQLILREWAQPRISRLIKQHSEYLRLLMWNPENLAQRLDLDNAVSKGKKVRLNSPPLRSVRKEWEHKIRTVDPNFIIYNEASLPGTDTKKRNNATQITREAEEFHTSLGYSLIIGFEGRGHASHGGAIAVKHGTVVTHVVYGFNGGREEQGRVLCVRVATEPQQFKKKTVDGLWIVQMYMHNSGEQAREHMMTSFAEWAMTHQEPVIIGSDTNSVDIIEEDVKIHPPTLLKDKVQLSDTLNMKTGEPIPNTGLEKAQIFLQTRADRMREFKEHCGLQDAQGPGGGVRSHTCNFAWMRWFPYAKKHKAAWKTMCPIAPCITARIDRFLMSEDTFKVSKIESFNEAEVEGNRNCRKFREIANLSDHFQLALEVEMKTSLKTTTEHQAFVNSMHVIQRTPEEQERHDRLTRPQHTDSDYEEIAGEEQAHKVEQIQAEERAIQELACEHIKKAENEQEQNNRWSRLNRSVLQLRVTCVREVNTDGVKAQEMIMKHAIPHLQTHGWVGDDITELSTEEKQMAENSWMNNNTSLFSDKFIVHASLIRFWLQSHKEKTTTLDKQATTRKRSGRITLEHVPDTDTGILPAIWKAIKSCQKWRDVIPKGRSFGIGGALHYLRCAYTTNPQVRVLMKTVNTDTDSNEQYFQNMTERIKNCQTVRQVRKAQTEKEEQVAATAMEQIERQLREQDESIKDGSITEETVACLEEGYIMQNESEDIEQNGQYVNKKIEGKWRRLPKYIDNNPNKETQVSDNLGEINICQPHNDYNKHKGRMNTQEMDRIMRRTTPRRTTRIKGSLSVGDWTRAREGDDRNGPEEMTGHNAQFAEADFEDDILLDTGCSYAIVSLAWLLKYCKKHQIDVNNTLIKYPKKYQKPAANTAAEGSTVQGVGFAKIKLTVVTLAKGQALEWNRETMREGGATTTVELETYVHVFENMGSAFLLGMPFIRDFTNAWDFRNSQISLRGTEEATNREIPIQQDENEQIPMRPVMVCTKDETYLSPHSDTLIDSYTVGTNTFPTQVDFHDSQDTTDWTSTRHTKTDTQLEYSIEAFEEDTRLHRKGFEVFGIAGRSIPDEQLSNPTIKVQCGKHPVIIPAGTPLAFVVQKYNGIPTYRWDRQLGQGMIKAPDEISQAEINQEADQIIAIPSAEMQKEYEIPAASFLEQTIQIVIEKHSTSNKSKLTSEEIAKETIEYTGLMASLEVARDGEMGEQTSPQKRLHQNITDKKLERTGVTTIKQLKQQNPNSWIQPGQPNRTAKLLIQMMWHLKSVARREKHESLHKMAGDFQHGDYEHLTTHISNKRESRAIKAVLRQLRRTLQNTEWSQWRREYGAESAVSALNQELTFGETRDDHESDSDYDSDSHEISDMNINFGEKQEVKELEPNPNDNEVEQTLVQEKKEQPEQAKPKQTKANENREHFDKANKEMEELYVMLMDDTATDNKMSVILEQPVAIQEHFQPKDEHGNTPADDSKYSKVKPEDIMELLDEKWQVAIRKACEAEVDDNGVQVEDVDRVNRMATYMMMVDIQTIKHDKQRVDLLFEYILKREPFYNINPNNPPRFKGEPFDFVRLRAGETPVAHQERRIPPQALVTVLNQIKEWMRQGVVEKSNSPHASPLLLVKKKALAPPLLKNGEPDPKYVPKTRWRTCVDYVQLNSKSEPTDISNAPRVDELLDFIGLAGSHKNKEPGMEYWVSTVDLYAGFNQWYLSDDVKPLTAFTVPGLAAEEGRLQFRVLPFGLASAPTRFNSLVATTLRELRFGHHDSTNETACCTNYIDDVFVANICTFEQHLEDMDKVFARLQEQGFGARMDKAEFCKNEISMLGWTIAEGHKSAQTSKLETIDKLKDVCTDVKDVLSMLGTVGFYRQLIPMAGDIEAPLYDLTRKGAWKEGAWTPIHTACVKLLKYHLKQQVKLAIPRLGKDPNGEQYPPIQLATDASQYAGGAVLFQLQKDGVERPICFASKTFTKEQRNWSATERELWTLTYFATEHFKHYLTSNDVILYTDHKPLTYLFTNRNEKNAKLARWSAKLSKLKATVSYRAGAAMGPADTFSRVIEGRPEKEQRDKETPENRAPIYCDRGPLSKFEPRDTTERNLSLVREAGIPQQRVMFLTTKTGTDTSVETTEIEPEDQAEEERIQGQVLTQEHIDKLRPEQIADIEQLRKTAIKEGQKQPVFRIAVGFNVTEAEDAITTEQDRINRRKEMQTIKAIPAEGEEEKREHQIFPQTAVIWTEVASKTMNKIFKAATGIEPEDEEEEFICRAESSERANRQTRQDQKQNLYNAGAGGPQGAPKDHINEILACEQSFKDSEDCEDSDYVDDEEERREQWNSYNDKDTLQQGEHTGCNEIARADVRDAHLEQTIDPQIQIKEGASPQQIKANKKMWEEVKEEVVNITRTRLRQLSKTGEDTLSEEQTAYIASLTDPKVTVVVCQGGAGTGKTYTAILVACIAVQKGLLANIKQTKPLVSTGGVGLGYERGEMADKLKYWCAPAREAMERMKLSETDRKKVEAFPIDRTRGISVPANEWMIFDEMQNAPKSLFDAAMTRAEQFGKVVICGDVKQQDVAANKGLGMHRFLDTWDNIGTRMDDAKQTLDKTTSLGDTNDKQIRENKKAHIEHERIKLATEAKEEMIAEGTTKVLRLDGSRAMRSATTNSINNLLDVCQIEESSQLLRGDQLHTDAQEIDKLLQERRPNTTCLFANRSQLADSDYEEEEEPKEQAPIFAAFAGMDLFGRGIKKGFSAGKCVGGSEINNTARLLFKRHHGFEPFRDQQLVPKDAYNKIFMVTTGAPCIAFSKAGSQKGQTDERGLHYVDQADTYIEAQVPIILFEQVPEARQILDKDWKSRNKAKSPQEQLVDKLIAGGYTVPEGTDGKPGVILNAAEHGSVLDRKRLFTLAVVNDLWSHSTTKTPFNWPEKKVTGRCLKEIFREPVRQDHLASEHMKNYFRPKEQVTKSGVQYKYTKDKGLGDWYNPNQVISEKGKGVSITAAGNSRWIEFTDIDGEKQWRRLDAIETAQAMGLSQGELREFQGLNEHEIHTAVGNGVCVEQGKAMGKAIKMFWDAKWFHNRTLNKKNEVLIVEQEPEHDNTTRRNEYMNQTDTKLLQKMWLQEETKQEKDDLYKQRGKERKPRGDKAQAKAREIHQSYNDYIKNEKLKFRRRVQQAINPEIITECTEHLELPFDGEVCNLSFDQTSKNIIENKPTMRRMIDKEHDLRTQQVKDKHFGLLIQSLEGKLDANTPQIQRAFLQTESEKYILHGENDVLCKITTSERTSNTLRVCVPSSLQDKLLEMCHDNPWTCHPTADQMYKMLSLRYYWPQMRAACTLYQRSCDICQRTGYPPKRHAGGRAYVPTSSPFACCAIDVVGPIGPKQAVTNKGNRWIVTIIDWFSRYVEAIPVKDTSEQSIIEALEDFTSRHGIPRRLVSDNAQYFRSKMIHQYEKRMGLKHTFVSAYRPQGNGRLERFHRVLGRKIKMACQEAGHNQWDEHLKKICFAHNVVPHSTTGYSPFELVYGRIPVTPFDTLQEPQEEHSAISHQVYMDRIRKSNAQAHQIAHERMADRQHESTQALAKENEDAKQYKEGEEVLLWIPSIPKGTSSKLHLKWHGPYVITEINKGKQVTIAIPKGDGGFKDKAVHVARLKKYRDRETIKIASIEQSNQVFELLDDYEVARAEKETHVRDGFDMLRKWPDKEHLTQDGTLEPGMTKWEPIFDGTERVGYVAGSREEEETPIPEEEKSPFDGQQLIEQSICDLTADDGVVTMKCKRCTQARDIQHACKNCFEKLANNESGKKGRKR